MACGSEVRRSASYASSRSIPVSASGVCPRPGLPPAEHRQPRPGGPHGVAAEVPRTPKHHCPPTAAALRGLRSSSGNLRRSGDPVTDSMHSASIVPDLSTRSVTVRMPEDGARIATPSAPTCSVQLAHPQCQIPTLSPAMWQRLARTDLVVIRRSAAWNLAYLYKAIVKTFRNVRGTSVGQN